MWKTLIQVTNRPNRKCTLGGFVTVAISKVTTLHQAATTKAVPHAQLLLMNNCLDKFEHIFNQLFHEHTETVVKRWYQTPEKKNHPITLNKQERRVFDEMISLRGTQNLKPTKPMHREASCSPNTPVVNRYSGTKKKDSSRSVS